jgi:hypothetical protein
MTVSHIGDGAPGIRRCGLHIAVVWRSDVGGSDG